MSDRPEAQELLARLDERTSAIQNEVSMFRQELHLLNTSLNTRFKEVEDRVNIKITNVEDSSDKSYVKVDQFAPVQKLVYGCVGVVVLAVLGAILTSVIPKH